MEARKSLAHKRLEAIQNSPTSSSPLRRKSSVQSTSVSTFSENDDEAERIARRREKLNEASALSPNRSSKRYSLGFLANIPAPQMTESINQCIKLSTENKINIKNAFSLEMIDFMTYMIKKQDANMSNLQVASTSLDVSTKIYGYRVDSVHMEILKMVGGLDKQDNTEEQGETQGGGVEVQTKTKSKKKKKAGQVISTVEALRGNIEIAKPVSMTIGEGDLQTSDMLYQATLPNHANSGFYQHLYNDVIVDVLEKTSESTNNSNARYGIPKIEDFSNLEICKLYSNFEFLGWSVENEPEEMSEEEAGPHDESGDRFQFDLDASVPADDEPAPEPMNYFNIEQDNDNNENNAQACYRDTTDANIVDVPNVRVSEYSFVQPSMRLHWAGPSHWKFWKFARLTGVESGTKVACMQAKQRKKKEFELLYDDDDDNVRDVIEAKFASSQSIKLHAKTAKAEWTTESLVLPEDVHYDVTELNKFYMYKKALRIENGGDKGDGDTVAAADVSDGENYDYNNPHDTLEYCPNVEHDDDYEDYENRDEGHDDCNFDDGAVAQLGSQGFTGDNLVAAPKLVNKIPIAYCLKAKRIDMRQLKNAMWTSMKSTNDNVAAANTEETANKTDTMKDSKQFGDIYKALPKLLTKSNTEALSVPIAFISMLHLANEKELNLRSAPDLADIIIEPGKSTSA